MKHYIKSEYGAAQISDAPGVGRGSMRGMGAAFEIGFEQKWDAAKLCKYAIIAFTMQRFQFLHNC